jgi:hypothetical protein
MRHDRDNLARSALPEGDARAVGIVEKRVAGAKAILSKAIDRSRRSTNLSFLVQVWLPLHDVR